VIRFEAVTVTPAGAPRPVLREVDLDVAEGEFCLVTGPTGSGKTTLLRCVNGLVPHFSGGLLAGRVSVDGRDTRTHRPRDLADVVGFVGQDPRSGFVTDRVEDELAYTMESLGVAPPVMRRRVEETLDLLGLAAVRDAPLLTLSAGEQQRVSIGSVLTAGPRVLVLDEPTSALDPPAAEEVLATLSRLVHDLGLTVLVAEHRLERVVQFADLVVHLPGGGAPVVVGAPGEVLLTSSVVPPVVALGRLVGWSPLPLSVRDARRQAPALRARLAAALPSGAAARGHPVAQGSRVTTPLEVSGLEVSRGGTAVLRGVDLRVRAGEVVALMGRNGAGKTTLLATCAGLLRPDRGRVLVAGRVPREVRPAVLARSVGWVPQVPGDLLVAATVAGECAASDRDSGLAAGATAGVLDEIAPGLREARADAHPRDLSEGQRLSLVLAVVMAARPPLILLDEPTRGLDYAAKDRLCAQLARLATDGHAVVVATHDVELAAEVSERTVVLADGEVVAAGPSRDVVTASPAFAPQVAKILAPDPWLTVSDVRRALGQVPA